MSKSMLIALSLAAVVAAPALTGGAHAQSFGDTRLSYKNGVVYDDDLVPGGGYNRPFLGGGGDTSSPTYYSSGSETTVRSPSRNLIGSDGRAIDAVRLDQRRTSEINDFRNRNLR